MSNDPKDVASFASPDELRAWLAEHHDHATELWIGFHRKASGRGGLTFPEAVDEALCFGWIDGIRKRLDDGRYTNRFTPRRPGSNWSAVNIARVEQLMRLGRMQPAGLAAFNERDESRSQPYSYERETALLGEDFEGRFRAHPKAWTFFQAQPPSYRRTAIWWVVSAKKEETRLRRLATLIEDSKNGRRLAAVTPRRKP